jgi:nicotinate phosphoribosyltransferase
MAMLTDLYELTMAAAYFEHRPHDRATFDLFVRKLPPGRNYLIFAGLEQALSFLRTVAFDEGAIRYLRAERRFTPAFLDFLRRFRFRGTVEAMSEGTVFFPNEPVLRVTGGIIEAQIVETFLLNTINLQTMIASKASRVVAAAQGRPVVEFGLRRAHGADAGLHGARAAYLAGCAGTSNVLPGQIYGIPIYGTMAHSFVQAFPSELEAFTAFGRTFPRETTFLIDTYDTVEGAHRAAVVAQELARRGGQLGGVRLDSGDLWALSRQVRRVLDGAGLRRVRIFASGNLTERWIADLLRRGAPIDAFGVGTELSVSSDAPSLDVVYKISEVIRDGRPVPTMKLSAHKQTYPGRKQVVRRVLRGRFNGDVLTLEGERTTGRRLLRPVMRNGRLVGKLPTLAQIRERVRREVASLPPRLRGLEDTSPYPVAISPGLRSLVRRLRHSLTSN